MFALSHAAVYATPGSSSACGWFCSFGVNAVATGAGANWKTDFALPDSESKDVQELLEANDPNRAGFTPGRSSPRPIRGWTTRRSAQALTRSTSSPPPTRA